MRIMVYTTCATLLLAGGCKLAVGALAHGVVKSGGEFIKNATDQKFQTVITDLYKGSAVAADVKYSKAAKACFTKNMNVHLSAPVPPDVIATRVEYEVYEMDIVRSENPEHIRHLAAWRKQSDKKILKTLKGSQKREVKKYLANLDKYKFSENVCMITELDPPKDRSTTRTASRRR